MVANKSWPVLKTVKNEPVRLVKRPKWSNWMCLRQMCCLSGLGRSSETSN